MAILFQGQHIQFKLKEQSRVKSWIKKIIHLEKRKAGQLNFVFTADEELLKMNIHYLNHSTYTDIITFDYCEDDTINGDIFISVERVRENSEKFKTSFEEELRRVIIHGVLHLCGYGDKTAGDKALMRKKEDQVLKKF
jgi:probable rRNA maturation factor